jgi:Carboxypeptidase regulatory-like domain
LKSKGFIFWSIIAVLLVALVAPCRTNAQLATTTATLSGAVNDPGGALIPNAKVTLTSPETGTTRESTTSDSGRYSFNQLPPGTYSLSVKMDGFRPYEQNGIVLDAGLSAAQNVTLTLGTQEQQIVVNAQASNLNTQNANTAADIDAKEVVELPLNLRNVYGLATPELFGE